MPFFHDDTWEHNTADVNGHEDDDEFDYGNDDKADQEENQEANEPMPDLQHMQHEENNE